MSDALLVAVSKKNCGLEDKAIGSVIMTGGSGSAFRWGIGLSPDVAVADRAFGRHARRDRIEWRYFTES